MHAVWNTAVKVGKDRLLSAFLIHSTAAIMAAAIMPFVEQPSKDSIELLAFSLILHSGYRFFLLQSYRVGDLSHVYPIARGTAPLGVAAMSGVAAGEYLTAAEIAGVAITSLGLFSLSFQRGAAGEKFAAPLIFAVFTGLFIAAYTVVDGLGVRAAGSAIGYILWLFILDGLILVPFALYLRRGQVTEYLMQNWRPGIVAGAMSFGAYAIVMWALALGPMVQVAALRETSVIFAAIIGVFFLKERFGLRRIVAAVTIALGIVVLKTF
ncbi:MAG: DMT family transporter, partial [Nitratireductor sp.]